MQEINTEVKRSNIPITTFSIILTIMMCAAGFILFSPATEAGVFVGASGVRIDAGDVEVNAATATVGYNFNSIVSIRAHTLIDSSGDKLGDNTVSIDSLKGAELVLSLPTEGSLQPFVSIGKSEVEISDSFRDISNEEDTFTTLGAGLRYNVSEAFDVLLEYQRSDDAEQLGLGFQINI